MRKFFRINQQITANEVQLIDEEGKSQKTVSLDQALVIANQRDYDLVEVNSSVRPPVCRLLDYGKYRYRLEKQERKSKHKKSELKEVRMKLAIESHDLETKMAKIKEFLNKGHKVRITLILRGREMAFMNRGFEFLKKVVENLSDIAKKEKEPERLGNRISVLMDRLSH